MEAVFGFGGRDKDFVWRYPLLFRREEEDRKRDYTRMCDERMIEDISLCNFLVFTVVK